MKTQAWGWLAAAVLAAGLNSSYHDGGLEWAHEIAGRVQHNTNAVLALATGRADQFLAEARMLKLDREAGSVADQIVIAENQVPHCPFSAAVARVQSKLDESHAHLDRLQALSARQQAREQERLARLEANRARMEARFQSNLARFEVARHNFRFADGNFSFANQMVTPVAVHVSRIDCSRVRVTSPHIPQVHVRMPRIETPVVKVDNGDEGPI